MSIRRYSGNSPRINDYDLRTVDESLYSLKEVYNTIKYDWPQMLREDANPIEMAVALLDDTSVGLAHRLQEFNMLKESSEQALRSVVNEHYDLFNKSMGSYNTLLSTMKTLRKTLWKSRTFGILQ